MSIGKFEHSVTKESILANVNCNLVVLNASTVAVIKKIEVKFIFKNGVNDNQVRLTNLGNGGTETVPTYTAGCVVGIWVVIGYIDGNGEPQTVMDESPPAPNGKCYSSRGVKLYDATFVADEKAPQNRIKIKFLEEE